MIFFCVLFLLKVFFIFKKQGAYACPGTNFLLLEFHQNIITLNFLKTLWLIWRLVPFICRPNFKDYYLGYIFFYKHYPYVYDLSSIARKAMPLREDWLWNKTICICYFYGCSINKFLGIFMTWYLGILSTINTTMPNIFDMIELRVSRSTRY